MCQNWILANIPNRVGQLCVKTLKLSSATNYMHVSGANAKKHNKFAINNGSCFQFLIYTYVDIYLFTFKLELNKF